MAEEEEENRDKDNGLDLSQSWQRWEGTLGASTVGNQAVCTHSLSVQAPAKSFESRAVQCRQKCASNGAASRTLASGET